MKWMAAQGDPRQRFPGALVSHRIVLSYLSYFHSYSWPPNPPTSSPSRHGLPVLSCFRLPMLLRALRSHPHPICALLLRRRASSNTPPLFHTHVLCSSTRISLAGIYVPKISPSQARRIHCKTTRNRMQFTCTSFSRTPAMHHAHLLDCDALIPPGDRISMSCSGESSTLLFLSVSRVPPCLHSPVDPPILLWLCTARPIYHSLVRRCPQGASHRPYNIRLRPTEPYSGFHRTICRAVCRQKCVFIPVIYIFFDSSSFLRVPFSSYLHVSRFVGRPALRPPSFQSHPPPRTKFRILFPSYILSYNAR